MTTMSRYVDYVNETGVTHIEVHTCSGKQCPPGATRSAGSMMSLHSTSTKYDADEFFYSHAILWKYFGQILDPPRPVKLCSSM